MGNKTYEELNEEYEKNKKRLIELDKIYNKNLDESLIPINQEEMDKTLKFIKELQNKQRQINEEMNELKKDNITDENNYNDDDEPTLELPKTKIEKELKKQVSNLKIVFDGKNGLYTVRYIQNNEEKIKLYTVDKDLLNQKNEYIYNGEKYNNLDLNVVKLLGEFDKELNTNYKDKYVTNNLDNAIIYDFRKFSLVNSQYMDNKQKRQLKKYAKEYKKNHSNCEIINFSTKKAAVLLGLSLAGAASGIGLSSNNQRVEEQKQESTELEKTEEKIIPEVKTEEATKQQEVTSEITEEKVLTKQKIEEEEKQDIKIEEDNIDNKINLDNVDLYNSAFDEGLGLSPRGNTDNIIGDNYTFDHFESSLIVVTYGPEVVELIKYNTNSKNDLINKCNELKNKYRESYGDDIKISLNVNACDENGNIISKDAGWFDSANIVIDNENVIHR